MVDQDCLKTEKHVFPMLCIKVAIIKKQLRAEILQLLHLIRTPRCVHGEKPHINLPPAWKKDFDA